jgi:hypothetical protein
MGRSNAANWAARWAKGVPDRANDPKRKVQKGDNPAWTCDNCGGQGAMDYAGQGRVCKSCASELGF